jgi:hypothetical protein
MDFTACTASGEVGAGKPNGGEQSSDEELPRPAPSQIMRRR